MSDCNLRDQRVLIREDLNVPVKAGVVTSDARIRAALPTIKQAIDAKARVLIMSHLGRPEEGVFAQEFSLAPVAKRLAELLGTPVELKRDWLNGVQVAAVLKLFFRWSAMSFNLRMMAKLFFVRNG